MSSFYWKELEFKPGTHGYLEVPVCHMASGYRLTLPVHIVKGLHDGPAILISAASHGEELWCTELARRIIERFAGPLAYDFAGTLIVAPMLNPHSFETGHRNTPIDLHNLNRVFPGIEPGRGWFTDMLARVIADEILPRCDIVFDYHGGGTDTVIHYTYSSPVTDDRSRINHEIALASGAEVIWEHHESRGTLTNYAEAMGKLCVVVEAGGGGVILEQRYFSDALSNLENMFRVLKVLPGKVAPSKARVVVREGRTVRPAHGGIFIPEVGAELIGKTVPGGTVLGRVVSPFTFEVLDELKAPYPKTELMQIRNRISKVHPGDYAYIVGDGDSGYHLG